jgi:hypothetical protein
MADTAVFDIFTLHLFRTLFGEELNENERRMALGEIKEKLSKEQLRVPREKGGNHFTIEPYMSGNIAHISLERHSQVTTNRPRDHEKEKTDDYPFVNIVFDLRDTDKMILMAVQRKSEVASAESIAQALENFLNVALDSDYKLEIQPQHLSSVFWRNIERHAKQHNVKIKSLSLCMPDISNYPKEFTEREKEDLMNLQVLKNMFANYLMHWDVENRQEKSVDEMKRDFGTIVHLACCEGYVVRAKVGDVMLSSNSTVMQEGMQLWAVETDPEKRAGEKRIYEYLSDWFDGVKSEIEKVADDEKTESRGKKRPARA